MRKEKKTEKDRPEINVQNPLKVTPKGKGFMIIDGERRWRAAKKAGLKKVKALVEFDLSDKQVFHTSVIANFCKEDMSVVEEAMAYERLMRENNWSQAQVSRETGKDPVVVSNALKVFKLHEDIQGKLLRGEVDPGTVLWLYSYKKSHQLFLLQHVERTLAELESEGRKKPGPQEMQRLILQEAEKQGFSRIKPKRGRKNTFNSVQLIGRSLVRALQRAQSEISELAHADLSLLDDNLFSRMVVLLEQIRDDTEDAVPSLKQRRDG